MPSPSPTEHDTLRQAVEQLNQNVTVLWKAIDDLCELLEWAVENKRHSPPESPGGNERMVTDPDEADGSELRVDVTANPMPE